MNKRTPITPNDCICQSTDVIATMSTAKGFRTRCIWCDRSGAWHKTLDEAIADWNRQTAAPDLLVALRALTVGISDQLDDYPDNELYRHTMALVKRGNTAVAKAEPKP